MDFQQELQSIASQYLAEGYNVVVGPAADQLPAFARDFGADLVARRGNENVLVQVKQDRSDLEADPKVPTHAEITNAQPGWRYDFVVLSESDPLRRLTRGAREPSKEEIFEILNYAQSMLRIPDVRAACVFSWSALEAGMRKIAGSIGLDLPSESPAELLRTLYGNGILSRNEFERLRDGFRQRTEIVHGFVPKAIDATLVEDTIAITRRLLSTSQEESTGAVSIGQ